MFAKRSDDSRRQDRHTILTSLGIAHDDFAALDDEILDPKPVRFHQPQPTAIKQIRDQPGCTVTLAMKERQSRIELGKGMERFISDAEAKSILDTCMDPAFAKGDFYGGLRRGLLQLMDKGRRFVVPADSIALQAK